MVSKCSRQQGWKSLHEGVGFQPMEVYPTQSRENQAFKGRINIPNLPTALRCPSLRQDPLQASPAG